MYRTILVPLDGSPESERALLMATALASASHTRLVLLRATWTPLARKHPSEARRASREARAYLAHIAQRLGQHGHRVETATPVLPAPEAILAEVARLQETPPAWEYTNPLASGPVLVVMSSRGDGGAEQGATTAIVLANSPAPVLLVRPNGAAGIITRDGLAPRLLAPLDGSPASEATLPHLAALAHMLNADVFLLRVMPEQATRADVTEAQGYLDRVAAHLRSEGVRTRTMLRGGLAASTITEESRALRASLLVMATHGETCAPESALGQVTAAVLGPRGLPTALIRPTEAQQHRPIRPAPEPLLSATLARWAWIDREIRV